MKQILTLTVNTGQDMFSREIYYYWPQIQLTKLLVNHRFSFAEWKYVVLFISNNYYIYIFEEIFWNICN